ncbi:hypothetical protein [Millisia brevis]|uniref:hypothetical protein n=1 Tax=Millisia brevis TaxID=264148 RepID=UPI00082BFDB4|nr:hypothetical protein [Millisia brevis]
MIRGLPARLAGAKLIGQFGDGMFQAALGGAILFDPHRAAGPLEIAVGFAVLLLPYSVLGPFIGTTLDRGPRKRALLVATVLRAGLYAVAAAALLADAPTTSVLVVALMTAGVSRFAAAGVSAALPNLVPPERVVTFNAALVTIGAGVTALGAGAAVGLSLWWGIGDGSAEVVATAVIAPLLAAAILAGFPADRLGGTPLAGGPLGPTSSTGGPVGAGGSEANGSGTAGAARETVRELVIGGLAAMGEIRRSRPLRTAFLALGTHRAVFGITTLAVVLHLRESASLALGGLSGFGVIAGATAAGMLPAAVVIPAALRRIGAAACLPIALTIAAVGQGLLVAPLEVNVLPVGAAVIGFAGQSIKLCGDAAVQLTADDDLRGRLFSLQDTVFNAIFVVAIAGAAALVGAVGAFALLVFGAILYAAAAAVVAVQRR